MSLIWLAWVGGLILAGLGAYAASLLLKLRAQTRLREQAIAARNSRILESVHLIAAAMVQGRCESSEGAIRLVNLLGALQYRWPEPPGERFPGLYALYEQIRDLPTHEARRALTKAERASQDRERARHEQRYNDQIQEDVAKLADFTLPT